MATARRVLVGWTAATVLVGLVGLALVGGCRCKREVRHDEGLVLPHYAEWPKLVDRAAWGDLETARVIAFTLTGGPEADWPGDEADGANSKIGAALGFIHFAEDAEELADAVASAARGCGLCHAAAEVKTDVPRPPWLHETAANRVVYGLVWGDVPAPQPGGEPPLDALYEAWASAIPDDTGLMFSEDEVRASRVITACAGCHGAGG